MLSFQTSFAFTCALLFCAFRSAWSDESELLEKEDSSDDPGQHGGNLQDSHPQENRLPTGFNPHQYVVISPWHPTPDPAIERKLLENSLSHLFGNMRRGRKDEMFYLYSGYAAMQREIRHLPAFYAMSPPPAGFGSQDEFDERMLQIQRDGGVNAEMVENVKHMAQRYVDRQASMQRRMTSMKVRIPGEDVDLRVAIRGKENLDAMLMAQFGEPGFDYSEEMWYQFAKITDQALITRGMPTLFILPTIPRDFHDDLELDAHVAVALQEKELEGQMFASVDHLAMKYMDDAINDYELQRSSTELRQRKAVFVKTLNTEFGLIEPPFLDDMWYHYRAKIIAVEEPTALKSVGGPILPARYIDEMDFERSLLYIQRDGGIHSQIVLRTEELAAEYLAMEAPKPLGSCKERCYSQYDSTHAGCHCNKDCMAHGDCCPDFEEMCASMRQCKGRCFDGFNPYIPCQCNDKCLENGNCCSDFKDHCLTAMEAVEHLQIQALREDNEVFKELVTELAGGYPVSEIYPLERKNYPQCPASGVPGCEQGKLDYMLQNDLKRTQNVLKLLWIRIMAATNDDLLVSSDAEEEIGRASIDGWGPESYEIIHPVIEEAAARHRNTLFFRNPGYYEAVEGFRKLLCSYRQCNVGECKLPPKDYSGVRQDIAGVLLKDKWSMQEFRKIDPKAISFDSGTVAFNDLSYQQRYLFDIWTIYLCSIQDMYGVVEFLLQHPTQKSLDLVLQSASHCECIDGFTGLYCNDCPNS